MPYSSEHKPQVRARIVKRARELFARRGFTKVSIDEIMAAAGLTRGGFYNHFKTKEELYAETLTAYAIERRDEAPKDPSQYSPTLARQILNQYVSRQHLDDVDGHCPLMALPSDVARAGPAVRAAYREALEVLVGMFEACMGPVVDRITARRYGLAIAATCVGAMVLARTIDDQALADEICDSVRAFASTAMPAAVDSV